MSDVYRATLGLVIFALVARLCIFVLNSIENAFSGVGTQGDPSILGDALTAIELSAQDGTGLLLLALITLAAVSR